MPNRKCTHEVIHPLSDLQQSSVSIIQINLSQAVYEDKQPFKTSKHLVQQIFQSPLNLTQLHDYLCRKQRKQVSKPLFEGPIWHLLAPKDNMWVISCVNDLHHNYSLPFSSH